MTEFPSARDYITAVQRSDSLLVDDLRRAQFARDPAMRVPRPARGTSAVVFKALLDGEPQAMRFFTREDASSRSRYDALQEHFAGHHLEDCVATASWTDGAIRINGGTWPLVRMQWIAGSTLNRFVEPLVQRADTAAIGQLATGWRELVVRLQRARFAHGDLQHGNVMIDQDGALRLVDFDCSWIDGFSGQRPPVETGHHNYQPPDRTWGRFMDTFPAVVVYTSLHALSVDPRIWDEFNTGDNLLFQQADFVAPAATAVWARLAEAGDPELDGLVNRLRVLCERGPGVDVDFESVLADHEMGRGKPRLRPHRAPVREWWKETPNAASGSGERPTGPSPSRPASATEGWGRWSSPDGKPTGTRPAGARPPGPGARTPRPRPKPDYWGGSRAVPPSARPAAPTPAGPARTVPAPPTRSVGRAFAVALLIAVVVGVVVAAVLDGVQRSAPGEPSIAVGVGLVVLLLGWPTAYYSQRRP